MKTWNLVRHFLALAAALVAPSITLAAPALIKQPTDDVVGGGTAVRLMPPVLQAADVNSLIVAYSAANPSACGPSDSPICWLKSFAGKTFYVNYRRGDAPLAPNGSTVTYSSETASLHPSYEYAYAMQPSNIIIKLAVSATQACAFHAQGSPTEPAVWNVSHCVDALTPLSCVSGAFIPCLNLSPTAGLVLSGSTTPVPCTICGPGVVTGVRSKWGIVGSNDMFLGNTNTVDTPFN